MKTWQQLGFLRNIVAQPHGINRELWILSAAMGALITACVFEGAALHIQARVSKLETHRSTSESNWEQALQQASVGGDSFFADLPKVSRLGVEQQLQLVARTRGVTLVSLSNSFIAKTQSQLPHQQWSVVLRGPYEDVKGAISLMLAENSDLRIARMQFKHTAGSEVEAGVQFLTWLDPATQAQSVRGS